MGASLRSQLVGCSRQTADRRITVSCFEHLEHFSKLPTDGFVEVDLFFRRDFDKRYPRLHRLHSHCRHHPYVSSPSSSQPFLASPKLPLVPYALRFIPIWILSLLSRWSESGQPQSNVRQGSEIRGNKDTHISCVRARPTISFCRINRILVDTLLGPLLLPSTTDESMVNAWFREVSTSIVQTSIKQTLRNSVRADVGLRMMQDAVMIIMKLVRESPGPSCVEARLNWKCPNMSKHLPYVECFPTAAVLAFQVPSLSCFSLALMTTQVSN